MGEFNILFTGRIKSTVNEKDLIDEFSQQFKVGNDVARRIVCSGKPIIIKKAVTANQSLKYLRVLDSMGMIVQREPIEWPQIIQENTSHNSKRIDKSTLANKLSEPVANKENNNIIVLATCPKCNYQATSQNDPLITAYNGKGECPVCGVIVSSYNDAPVCTVKVLEEESANGQEEENEAHTDNSASPPLWLMLLYIFGGGIGGSIMAMITSAIFDLSSEAVFMVYIVYAVGTGRVIMEIYNAINDGSDESDNGKE